MAAKAEEGYTIIKGSRRPDGTYRKDIKVRAGYVNPDEPGSTYESRGKQFANERDKMGVVGAVYDEPAAAPKLSKNAKRNAKKREKKAEGGDEGAPAEAATAPAAAAAGIAKMTVTDDAAAASGPSEKEKKIRALKKKLRQITDLEGEIAAKGLEPNDSQKEKLSKKSELLGQIKALEG